MVVWADDRNKYCDICDFTIPNLFAMLLTPHGPATAPLPLVPAPVLVPPSASSRGFSHPSALWLRSEPGTGHRVQLSLLDGSRALLELFDISGRRIWSRELDGLAPGPHELRLGDGAWFPSGIYMARLTQGNHEARVRVALLH